MFSLHLFDVLGSLSQLPLCLIQFSTDFIHLLTQLFFAALQFPNKSLVFSLLLDTSFELKAASPGNAADHESIHLKNDEPSFLLISTDDSSSLVLILHGIIETKVTIFTIKCVSDGKIEG